MIGKSLDQFYSAITLFRLLSTFKLIILRKNIYFYFLFFFSFSAYQSQKSGSNLKKKSAVKAIKRQHLVEVRSMSNPPLPVRMALESICLLLDEPFLDWKTIRTVIVKDNFIPNIINFNSEVVS